MKIAHKMLKQFPKMSFKACLSYAWKIVKKNIKIAQKIVDGTYTVKVKVFVSSFYGKTLGVEYLYLVLGTVE